MRQTKKKSTGIGKAIKNVAKGTVSEVKHVLKAGVNCAVAQGASDAVNAFTGGAASKGRGAPAKRGEKGAPEAAAGRARKGGTTKKRSSTGGGRKPSRAARSRS